MRQDQPKVDLSENNEFNKEELMTETLAKVYLQQKIQESALRLSNIKFEISRKK